ncbi:hypothetical protein H8E88_09055 [candidate division KSB1 bacterium]|nr:hypothetical protein [candidate division KSB1 bacterium]MBL7094074.1 hypothetical protein [candidate division KSB1 bacterium]
MINCYTKNARLTTILWCYFYITLGTGLAQQSKQYNWIAPPPKYQLDQEAMDDIKGLGRLFLPAMTNSDFEPVYTIFQNDTILKTQRMGKSVFLRPGKYSIKFGSGTLNQMMKKNIQIQAEETRIIEPDWCGLTIRIIDETRNWLKEPYEIYCLPAGEAFGIGYGADEQLGENLQTWILKPGLYKIVKSGEHVNTYINFATVRLLPGDLTQYTIVMDSDTKKFTGAGILESEIEKRSATNWTTYSALYGSFTLNRANNLTSSEEQTSMAFVAQLDYNIKYSTNRHFFLSRGLIEEGWNMQAKQSSFRSYLDNIRLKNTYIFYFLSGLGLYGRFFLETNMFRSTYYYDEPKTVTLFDKKGNLKEKKFNVDKVIVAPNFSPLELKEGLGINYSLIRSLRANFNVRVGFGYRQNINWKLYSKDAESDTAFFEKNSVYLRGPEASLLGNLRILRNMMITSELDVLVPSGTNNQLVYDWENNLNLRLSKNISIDYTIRIKKDPSIISYIQTEQILLLRYSFILF